MICERGGPSRGRRAIGCPREFFTGERVHLRIDRRLSRDGDRFKAPVVGAGPEKDLHPWQQGVAEAEHFVGRMTEPGELIVDPFLGSGTTAVAASRLGRRFVGCDVDRRAVRVARRRIGSGKLDYVPFGGALPELSRCPK